MNVVELSGGCGRRLPSALVLPIRETVLKTLLVSCRLSRLRNEFAQDSVSILVSFYIPGYRFSVFCRFFGIVQLTAHCFIRTSSFKVLVCSYAMLPDFEENLGFACFTMKTENNNVNHVFATDEFMAPAFSFHLIRALKS